MIEAIILIVGGAVALYMLVKLVREDIKEYHQSDDDYISTRK